MITPIAQRIWKTDKVHKNGTRLVLLALAESIDSGNSCPSVAELADMAQVTPASARHALAQLEADETIKVKRQAGKSEKGGRTNCYSIPAYQDNPAENNKTETDASANHPMENHPPEIHQATPKQGGDFHQGTEIPEGGNSPGSSPEITVIPFTEPEISTDEYAGAAGENALSKSSPVLSSLDQTRQPVDTVRGDPAAQFASTDLPASSTIQQHNAAKSISVEGGQLKPPPNSAEPPSTTDGDDADIDGHWHTNLGPMTAGIQVRLSKAVSGYGMIAVKAAIDAAKLEGARIRSPMAWIETRLEGQQSEGKLPGKEIALVPKPRTSEPEPFMKFTGWGSPAPAEEVKPC